MRPITVFFIILILIGTLSCKEEEYPCALDLPPYRIYHTFDEFYESVVEKNRTLNIRPGTEERLVRNSNGKSKIAILYVHGFGASRAEGEEVMLEVAEELNANIYFIRLPGHGTTPEDHRDSTFREHVTAVRDALVMMDTLGERVFLVGSSYGGLISTYVTALFPHRISGDCIRFAIL
jgi:pimeloyl-ACP methyl ester carboxylesterase